MIHEITEEVLKKDLSSFDIITFDDGLYSQYLNIEHFKKFKKPMIFFISTAIVCPENVKQSDEILYCGDCHKKAFNGNFENYMTWKQIQEISKMDKCKIAGHSHNHKVYKTLPENIKDINTMITEFKRNGIAVESFCFPYNLDSILQKLAVQAVGIFTFYGKSRIPVESL